MSTESAFVPPWKSREKLRIKHEGLRDFYSSYIIISDDDNPC